MTLFYQEGEVMPSLIMHAQVTNIYGLAHILSTCTMILVVVSFLQFISIACNGISARVKKYRYQKD